MALQLSDQTKNKGLNNVFRPSTLYVMIPAVDSAPNSTDLPRAVINFNHANYGRNVITVPVQLAVERNTTIDAVYLHTSPLTKGSSFNALVKIELSGDDVEVYDNDGVYIINTINVAINT